MGITVESVPVRTPGLRSSSLRRALSLRMGECRLTVEPDGTVRSLYSLRERRALFGFEQLWLDKVQAGVIINAQRPDWAIRLTPRSVQFSGRVFDSVEVVQGIEFYRGESRGYVRRFRMRNGGQGSMKLRALGLMDPTAAHFGDSSDTWGSLGVNAFNRESHVAMDEVSDPPSARVVGAIPSPSKIYMTTSRSRAQELLSMGELPDATAGMSGQVLVLVSHEIELAPGESKEITIAAIYNPGKLEEALSDFGRLQSGEKSSPTKRSAIACSEQGVTDSATWGLSSIEGAAYAEEALDRYEALKALGYLDPTAARGVLAQGRVELRKDGSLPHSLRPTGPGVLETAVFLHTAAWQIVLAQDKKLARTTYPLIKKLAGFLVASSKDFAVQTDPSLPQGWRRHLGSGFPTGEIPEISLAVAGALADASQVARMVSRSDDAGRFRERAEMISDRVGKKLLDDRGFLALCRDSAGRLRNDETIDCAVASYRHPFMASAELAAAHRLLEKDFDTPYGPRCVPSSNQVYFNRAYGQGQLGGVWTRAVLAYALVCYRTGLSGIGSLILRKVAKLVTEDAPRLGSSPGEFPQWVDVDSGEAHSGGGDPVAAARFIEALLEGELGLPSGAERPTFSPASSSGLGWLMVSDIWLGEAVSAFLGRASGTPHLFFSGSRVDSKAGTRFAKSERLDMTTKGVYGMTFYSPGQIVCLGNSTASQAHLTVSFSPKSADMSKHLSTSLEAYDPSKGSFSKMGSLRVFSTMSFEATIDPNDWKVYRVSTP
jgi:hypothetical protein